VRFVTGEGPSERNDEAGRVYLIAPTSAAGLQEEAFGDSVLKVSREKLEQASNEASEIAQIMMERLRQASEAVSEITVEFGLAFEGKAGIPFITEAKAGATFTITVTWDLRNP
jgi:Trypsin-co-occurring domain 1